MCMMRPGEKSGVSQMWGRRGAFQPPQHTGGLRKKNIPHQVEKVTQYGPQKTSKVCHMPPRFPYCKQIHVSVRSLPTHYPNELVQYVFNTALSWEPACVKTKILLFKSLCSCNRFSSNVAAWILNHWYTHPVIFIGHPLLIICNSYISVADKAMINFFFKVPHTDGQTMEK